MLPPNTMPTKEWAVLEAVSEKEFQVLCQSNKRKLVTTFLKRFLNNEDNKERKVRLIRFKA